MKNDNNTVLSFFDSLEGLDLGVEQKKEEPKSNKKTTEKSNKNTTNTKTKTLSKDETLEKELAAYLKVEVKVYGSTVTTITGDEVENIKLENIKANLISMGYEELRGNVSWISIPNEDKTETILTVIPKFFNKG